MCANASVCFSYICRHVWAGHCGHALAAWHICAAVCVGHGRRSLCALACVRHRVFRVVGVGGAAGVPHISRGVLLAGPDRSPLRFMECHSVAAAVNQVNVAEPISSVVLRSRWKNNI